MSKPELDRYGRLVFPVYPCIKSEGLCRLRHTDDPKFQCDFDGPGCRYNTRKEKAVPDRKEEQGGATLS